MSLESQRQGLFLVVSRKRERSPSFEREQSSLLAPPTPPATQEKRRIVDEEVMDWGMQSQEWDNYMSRSVQSEPSMRSHNRLWWAHDNSVLLVHQDSNDESSNSNEDCSSHLPLAMSTANLSTAESYNIGTQPGLWTMSPEDLEDIANAVTPLPIVSERAHAMEPDIAEQTPANGGLQLGDPVDKGSCNLPGNGKLCLSSEEKSVGSSS